MMTEKPTKNYRSTDKHSTHIQKQTCKAPMTSSFRQLSAVSIKGYI